MSDQFGKRYRVDPPRADNPSRARKRRFIEEEQARLQAARPSRPDGIGWFEERLLQLPEKDAARPRVGVYCNMVPPEIIEAMGAAPVRLDCGNHAVAAAGEEILSGEVCPVAKASFGAFLHGDPVASGCEALIVPTSCDAKKKMAEILDDYRPAFALNLPPEQDHGRYAKSAAAELLRMADFLRPLLKRKLSAGPLRAAILATRHRSDLIRRLQETRSADPRSLSVRDLFIMIQAGLFRPTDSGEWLERTERVLAGMKQPEETRKSLRPRILLTGAPIVWPNFKPLNLLEECGADVVADTVCTGVQSCIDPVVVDERSLGSLVRALACRYIFGAICPCFISQETRLNRILDLVERHRARAVVNYSLRLCPLFDVENYRMERILRQRDIPFLNLRTDYSLEDTEQLRVRLEAFLETLS